MFLTIDYLPAGESLGKVLVKSPYFWLVIILTISVIWPWLRLRKVDVVPEVLSNHAVRLWFDYGGTSHLKSLIESVIVLTIPHSHSSCWHGHESIRRAS